MTGLRYTWLIAAVVFMSSALEAQPIREELIHFAAGTSGTTIQGQITGSEVVDYVLTAKAGQRAKIDFSVNNPSAYFNLLPASDPTSLHTGSVDGNSYDGTLIRTGDYRVRVYLMRNAARRNETADYSLSIAINGDAAPGDLARSDDFADGLTGGPDLWQVYGLSSGRLNVRASPGMESPVVDQLSNSNLVSNLGCQMVGADKWCEIGDADRKSIGWAIGRYLHEASPLDSKTASGAVPCAMSVSQPTGSCPFRVTRHTGGTASVWISTPDGGERYLDFREGNLVGSDPGLIFKQDRRGDLNVISVGEEERYEIPDAVIYGG